MAQQALHRQANLDQVLLVERVGWVGVVVHGTSHPSGCDRQCMA